MVAISECIMRRINKMDAPISVADARDIRREISELAHVYVTLTTTNEARAAARVRANAWLAEASALLTMQIVRHEQ